MKRSLLAVIIGLTLAQLGGCPPVLYEEVTDPGARVTTSAGQFVIRFDIDLAPHAATNFATYATNGFYDNTVFHQVLDGEFIRGGGWSRTLVQKGTGAPIINESDNGLSNTRGTIAIARTEAPDSATSQFYFNVVDNPSLDPAGGAPGYAVFGEVVSGLDVVDRIAAEPTTIRDGMSDVPERNIAIESVERIELTVDEETVEGVRMVTTFGTIDIRLFPDQAPVTVQNFLQYVDDSFYVDTIFHRVIEDFVAQGGGFESRLSEKTADLPADPETDETPPDPLAGTVGLLSTLDPGVMTPQFVVNLIDDPTYETDGDPDFTVFGTVTEGLDVVAQIAGVTVEDRDGLTDVPVNDVTIEGIEIIDIATGEQALTPEGEEWIAYKRWEALTILHDIYSLTFGWFIRTGGQ